MLLDIRPDHLRMVLDILQKHVPQYEVWAFGSRAKWTAKDYSDLDLCIVSDQPLSFSLLGALAEDFSDSDLPWKVDVVDWATVSESFRKIIARDKVVVQKAGMSEWTSSTLADVSLDVSYGYTESASSDNVGPRFLRITDIQNGVVDWSNVPYCPISEANHQKYRLDPGDIVVARTGNSTGENFLYKGSEDAVFASYLIRFRIDSQKADSGFVWYNLRSDKWWGFINNSKTGSAQAGANAKVLGQFQISFPSLDEQRAIAHILGTLDDKIELNRRMNETLEAIARAIFKSWFVDFDPVRAKMSGEPPESICQRLGLTPDLLALFPDRLIDSELGEIPEGWSASTLGSHIEIFDSKRVPLSNREREKRKGIYPYYGATSVMDHVDDFIFDGIYVLIGEDGSVVKENGEPFLQYVWGKFWVNNHAHVLQAKKPVSNEHLLLMLKQTNVASFVTGAVQLKISQGNLKRIPFVSATEPLIKNFAKIIAPLFDMIRAREDEIKILIEERDALLPKLLSGELRVPDLEGKLRVTA